MINTLNESQLHKALKTFYAVQFSAQEEVQVDRWICDLACPDGGIIEIQTKNVGALKEKAGALLAAKRRVTIVHPIIKEKIIETYAQDGKLVSRRKSPKKESLYSELKEFTGIAPLLTDKKLSVLLPEKLTTVYERAFADCTALESVISMTKQSFSVSTDTFLNCPKLKELTYHSSGLSYGSHSLGYLLDADGNYTKNTVPVNVIGLYNSNLETLISEGVITCTPVGLTYHVIPETDTICIDFIAVPEGFSENTCYIPALIDGKTVAVRYKNQIALAFHPEIGKDSRIHKMFADMIFA